MGYRTFLEIKLIFIYQTGVSAQCICGIRKLRVSTTKAKRAAQVEVRDPKWICPDRPRRKVPMSRPSQTQSAYVQTVPDGKWISPDYRAFKTFRAFFVRSKANMSRPSQTETVYVQTFVRSCPDHRALQIKFVRSTPKF